MIDNDYLQHQMTDVHQDMMTLHSAHTAQ